MFHRLGEPYRLYNLDTFAYDLHSRLGLYGCVPLLLAHKPDRTLGVFWLNASETFLDVGYSSSEHQVGVKWRDKAGLKGKRNQCLLTPQDEPAPPVKRRCVEPRTDVRWVSEGGVIDCRVLLGPGPHQLFSQYAHLTGV